MIARSLAVATGAGVGALTLALARRLPAEHRARWLRTNHAGRDVTLLEGPAHAISLAVAGLLAGPAPVLAATSSGALGALDDLTGDASSKGLRGHLSAARRGQVTTGLVKIGGLALTGVASTLLLDRGDPARSPGLPGALLGGAVVAGSANLLNLFDLRPGRALKVGLLMAAPLALGRGSRGVTAAGTIGAALAALPPDLRGESMLGDTGANALGAVLGVALVDGASTRSRWVSLAVLTGLTLASERVSFTKVIESTPVLREVDAWGRARR
jgi:UDP-N-acetylmuramyl pentapeptide phosphotransferase/UDP-N-acetylglucosamine-1-phosphate transferase